MLSKSTGSASTWSAEVAPWRSTITKPPARHACASVLSSAAADPAARPPSSADSPPASARAANALRDPLSMLNPCSNQEHALTGGLRVEQLVGLLGLLQLPAM